MQLVISNAIEAKIGADDHGNVTCREVEQCFENHDGRFCQEQKAEHHDWNGNPSLWFVGYTNKNRRLKIMFVIDEAEDVVRLKSAYPATDKVALIFNRHAGPMVAANFTHIERD